MSTPTPITDYASERTDAFDSPAKAREFARRLELDRAALMEALKRCLSDSYDGPLPAYAREAAQSALSTARANFPES